MGKWYYLNDNDEYVPTNSGMCIGPAGPQGEQGPKGEKGDTGAQGPQGEKGDTGAQGPQGEKGDTGAQGPQGEKGDTGAQGPQGEKGDAGEQGPAGAPGPQGEDGKSAYEYAQDAGYTGTEAEFAKSIAYDAKAADERLSASIAGCVKSVNGAEPDEKGNVSVEVQAEQIPIVDSIEEMTDTNKAYCLSSDGYIYRYKTTTTEQEVTVTDELDDTTYYDGCRLGSSSGASFTDSFQNDATGYHLTPLIDFTKEEYVGKTIQLHLEGVHYVALTNEQWIQNRAYNKDGSGIYGRANSNPTDAAQLGAINIASYTIDGDTSATITFNVPVLYGSLQKEVAYMRFCGKGAVADSRIYITYQDVKTITVTQWTNTGIKFVSDSAGIDEEARAAIAALNNEGASPATVKLLPQPVLDFYNTSDYPSDDYSTTHLGFITYPCRADIPIPYTVKWQHNENAMRTTVAIDTKVIGTSNRFTMLTYDATGYDSHPLYNLLPDKTYYYKVTHILADGSLVEAKSGSFTTSGESVRLIYIDGTQNVRDLGGWTGLDGKTVKYGKIFRGAAFSDSSYPELMLTGKGKRSLGELKVVAELNLGADDTETSIAANCSYKKIGYANYATAITDATRRAQFKEALEHIMSCLATGNIYMHCQGGCDRTGTLSFQLLGLLGVSESDLAKEYELSSFSSIGYGRLRTTTYAVNTYDYVGMVEALKGYSGDTITDKFYDFATTGCGISADTITAFRSLMLE